MLKGRDVETKNAASVTTMTGMVGIINNAYTMTYQLPESSLVQNIHLMNGGNSARNGLKNTPI